MFMNNAAVLTDPHPPMTDVEALFQITAVIISVVQDHHHPLL